MNTLQEKYFSFRIEKRDCCGYFFKFNEIYRKFQSNDKPIKTVCVHVHMVHVHCNTLKAAKGMIQ